MSGELHQREWDGINCGFLLRHSSCEKEYSQKGPTIIKGRELVVLVTTRGEQTACCPGFGLVAALAAAFCWGLLRSAAANTHHCVMQLHQTRLCSWTESYDPLYFLDGPVVLPNLPHESVGSKRRFPPFSNLHPPRFGLVAAVCFKHQANASDDKKLQEL